MSSDFNLIFGRLRINTGHISSVPVWLMLEAAAYKSVLSVPASFEVL